MRNKTVIYHKLLIFRPRSPEVMIVVAVAHTSRRPGYWRRRK
jgi:hypothetical protein